MTVNGCSSLLHLYAYGAENKGGNVTGNEVSKSCTDKFT